MAASVVPGHCRSVYPRCRRTSIDDRRRHPLRSIPGLTPGAQFTSPLPLPLHPGRAPLGQSLDLGKPRHAHVAGKRRQKRAVRPAQPQRFLRLAAGQQAVNQPGGETIAAADAAEHVQLHRGRGILPAGVPQDGRPVVPIGRLHLAERRGHHLDVRILPDHLLHQLVERGRVELRLGVYVRTEEPQALLQVFLVAKEHVDAAGDATHDLLPLGVASAGGPELRTIVQIERRDGPGGLRGLDGFQDQFGGRLRQGGKDAPA